jgi:protein phosphatase
LPYLFACFYFFSIHTHHHNHHACRYSRAFGGKDLKPFGLSASPSVRQVAIASDHVGFVLCSDGVCDVAEADDVAAVVGSAWARGEDASAVLVQWAMQERQRVGIGADNVTAVVVKFEPVKGGGGGGSGGGRK